MSEQAIRHYGEAVTNGESQGPMIKGKARHGLPVA
jgi:hypothetical protein